MPEARFLIESDTRSYYNAEPADLSLLFLAQQWNIVADVPYGAEETMRVAGGNSQLPEAMATSLGSALLLGQPVRSVSHDRDGVRVVTDGEPVDAAHLELAMPPRPLRDVRLRSGASAGCGRDGRWPGSRPGGQGHHRVRAAVLAGRTAGRA